MVCSQGRRVGGEILPQSDTSGSIICVWWVGSMLVRVCVRVCMFVCVCVGKCVCVCVCVWVRVHMGG